MKEDNFNENDLSLDEIHRKERVSSSTTEIIQYQCMKKIAKKCKKNFFFILALIFVVLGIYYIKLKQGNTFMKKTKKLKIKLITKKKLDSKEGKLNKDKEWKTKRIGKYKIKEIKGKLEMNEKDDIKKVDKYLSKKKKL